MVSLLSCICFLLYFFSFAYSHPQCNRLSDSRFRRRLSQTAVRTCECCVSAHPPPAIFEAAIDSVVRISIPEAGDREVTRRKESGPKQHFEAGIGFFIIEKQDMTITVHFSCRW